MEEKEIRTLERGDYFGEQALINEDKRTANIIAMAPGVECLTLDRDSFTQLIGDLCELKEKNYGDENRVLAMKYAENTKEIFGANIKQGSLRYDFTLKQKRIKRSIINYSVQSASNSSVRKIAIILELLIFEVICLTLAFLNSNILTTTVIFESNAKM